MDSGGGWGGDRAPLFDRRELDRVPLTRSSTTQPVGTVHTTHSNQNDPSQTRGLRQPGNGGHEGRRAEWAANATNRQDGRAGIGGPRSWSDNRPHGPRAGSGPRRVATVPSMDLEASRFG